MKNIFLIGLLFLSIGLTAQTPFSIRGEIRQVYKVGAANDTTSIKLSGDSALINTTQSRLKTNKPFYAPSLYQNNLIVATRSELSDTSSILRDSINALRNDIGTGTGSEPLYKADSADLKSHRRNVLYNDLTITGEKTFSDTSKFSKGILVTGKININTAVSDSSINALNMHLTRGAKIDGIIQGGTVLINSGTVIDSSAITWKTAENIAKYHANNQTEYICPLSGYDVDVGDTIKIGIGNVFEDASIVITNYVLRDTLSESKVLGTGIMILPENGRLTVSTGQKISNASLEYSLSFEINADLETIDMVFINNSSASLNIKFNINRIKQ